MIKNTTPLPELKETVRRALREKGRSQQDFALSERLDPDTFRAQLTRNTYSQHTLVAIAKLLNCENANELEKNYEFKRTERRKEIILQPTQSIRERVNRTIKTVSSELREDIRRLYSWLGPNDLAVICTLNEPPLECTTNGWNILRGPLREGIENGATFVYIRPENEVIKDFSNVLSEFFSRKTPQEEVDELKSKLISEGITKKEISKQIRLYPAKWCPFWAIGMRFGFYSIASRDGGGRDMTLFARFPFGGILSGDSLADPNLLLFGDKGMRDAFQAYLINCFESKTEFRDLLDKLR